MISKQFGKIAAGALALNMAFATPAMAGAECTATDKANASIVRGHEVRVIDFSNSSVACLEDFASKVSRRDMLLVAKSNSQAWRDATVVAAERLKSEGVLVAVAYANDEDGLNTTAATWAWANGVKRSIAPVSIKPPMNIDHIAHAPDKVVNFIHEVGSEVWNKYLKLPDVAMK